MDALDIPKDDQKYIIEKTVDGYSPEQIAYLLKEEEDSYVGVSAVKQFIGSDQAQNKIQMVEGIRKRKAEVTRKELITDLKEAKEGLKTEIEKLREKDRADISNESMSNLISNIKLLGEFIGELQQETPEQTGTININKLEQNFNFKQAIQYMPPEDKKTVAEQLADDPDVQDYIIKKQQ